MRVILQIGISAALIAPGFLRAQAPAAPVSCAGALQILQRGGTESEQRGARRATLTCDAEGRRAMAKAFRDERHVADTVALGRLFEVMRAWRDGALVDAALEIASDRSASVPARVFAFAYLARIREPHTPVSYQELAAGLGANGLPRSGCGAGRWSSGTGLEEGSAVSPTWVRDRQSLARRVYRDTSEAEPVRSAAYCAY